MPASAETERKLLNHYKLTSLYPTEWPHAVDDSSDTETDDEQPNGARAPARHQSKMSMNSRTSLSKFRNIDRHASLRSTLSGTQKTQAGEDSLVQKDEPDPLGMAPSVASELRRRGLPVESDALRNRFMLSSTSFSPQLFLSQVHQDASTEDLLCGLEFLSRSIEQKSASLKVLVESNFERFVEAKATIDNVYTEMRTQGQDPEDQQTQAGRRPHSRHTSKNQSHFRNSSNPFSPSQKAPASDKRKNALTKESEYGVQGIKTPLLDVAVKAEEVWGPALGGREKEETLKQVLSTLEQHREIFRLSGSMYESIRKNDFDTVVSDYRKAARYADEARQIATVAKENNAELGDQDVNQIIVTARMWHDVSEQIESFKRDVWKRLKNSHGRKSVAMADEADKELHMELIGVLLQLGVDENPIWEWLHSRYLYLKDKIARSFERSRIEIEILRRRLASHERTDVKMLATYLRSAGSTSSIFGRDKKIEMDTPAIVAFWEKVLFSINNLLSTQTGVLGEVIEFWETTQSFIDNKAQKSFPDPVFAAGLDHLELEPDDVQNLRSGAVELVNLIRETTFAFFSDPPVEDLSELYSPIPPTPITPDSGPGSALTPSSKRAFTFSASEVPPPSPKRGDAWEKFAFWPPYANSLSGSHYLSRVLALVGTAASEMASLSVIKQARSAEQFKTLVGGVRERCVQAVCAAWNTDAERCKYLETWTRHSERRDLTTMPASFMAFEEKLLANMQKIAYISEAASARGSSASDTVVVPPSAKLLQAIRGCFVTSLYKALSGMVENAEKLSKDGASDADPDGVTMPQLGHGVMGGGDAASEGVGPAVDASNRNVRMLMTLSNLAHLRSEIIPQLVSQFEASFSVKLTEESKTIRDVLGQIDARLFQSYVRPTVEKLQGIIQDGISSANWVPQSSRPTDAKPYVYDVLLTLVLVHSEVSTIAQTLTNQILSYLLEQASLALINAFRQRTRYTLPALMQATLDVEFMAQTLNNYTTDRAGEVQSQIYLALDERTDNEARAKLQGELPEMRAILKKLREGTKGEFGCFKRERRGRNERPGSSSR